jgi:hypothetical protein
LRHLPAQHAALGLGADLALAGDDEHEGEAVPVRALQKVAPRSRSCPATAARARGGRAAPIAVWPGATPPACSVLPAAWP